MTSREEQNRSKPLENSNGHKNRDERAVDHPGRFTGVNSGADATRSQRLGEQTDTTDGPDPRQDQSAGRFSRENARASADIDKAGTPQGETNQQKPM